MTKPLAKKAVTPVAPPKSSTQETNDLLKELIGVLRKQATENAKDKSDDGPSLLKETLAYCSPLQKTILNTDNDVRNVGFDSKPINELQVDQWLKIVSAESARAREAALGLEKRLGEKLLSPLKGDGCLAEKPIDELVPVAECLRDIAENIRDAIRVIRDIESRLEI